MQTTRRQFLSTAFAAPLAAAAPVKPNIIYIVSDQHRAQAVGCLGDEQARTPNLDRMASEGLILENTFANSPVCCPSRAIWLTGQYCHRNGMVANDLRLRENSISYAKLLRAAGYRTGMVGKWHLDGGKRLPGFVPPGERRQGFAPRRDGAVLRAVCAGRPRRRAARLRSGARHVLQARAGRPAAP